MPRNRNDDAQKVLVCLRTEDLVEPHTAAFEDECFRCHAPVWVAKSSPKTSLKMCLPCAKPHLPSAEIGPLTQKQIDDVVRHKRWFR